MECTPDVTSRFILWILNSLLLYVKRAITALTDMVSIHGIHQAASQSHSPTSTVNTDLTSGLIQSISDTLHTYIHTSSTYVYIFPQISTTDCFTSCLAINLIGKYYTGNGPTAMLFSNWTPDLIHNLWSRNFSCTCTTNNQSFASTANFN